MLNYKKFTKNYGENRVQRITTWVLMSMEKYASEQARKTVSQNEAHMTGGPGLVPTSGWHIEHSITSHRSKHSWLASPAEASLLIDAKAGRVWATSQHVFSRKTLQSVKSLRPLAALFGGFPSDLNGGKRPPGDMHTSTDFPGLQCSYGSSIRRQPNSSQQNSRKKTQR